LVWGEHLETSRVRVRDAAVSLAERGPSVGLFLAVRLNRAAPCLQKAPRIATGVSNPSGAIPENHAQ
jgi:hypothetical protein